MVKISGDWSKYVQCDDKTDCQDMYRNTAQCLPEFNACAPLKCFDDTDCLNVPLPKMEHDYRELFGGSCNKEFNCEYQSCGFFFFKENRRLCEYIKGVLNKNVSSTPFPGSDFLHLDNNSSEVINSCLALLAYGFGIYLFFS